MIEFLTEPAGFWQDLLDLIRAEIKWDRAKGAPHSKVWRAI
jgi:hypothetical protein